MKTKNLVAIVLIFYLWPVACLGAYYLATRSMESGGDALALIPIVGVFEVMGFVAFAVVARSLKRAESKASGEPQGAETQEQEGNRCAKGLESHGGRMPSASDAIQRSPVAGCPRSIWLSG